MAFSHSSFCFQFVFSLTLHSSSCCPSSLILFFLPCYPLTLAPGFLVSYLWHAKTLPRAFLLAYYELNANCFNIILTVKAWVSEWLVHVCSHHCIRKCWCGAKFFLNEFTKSHNQRTRSLETFIQNTVIVETRCFSFYYNTFVRWVFFFFLV